MRHFKVIPLPLLFASSFTFRLLLLNYCPPMNSLRILVNILTPIWLAQLVKTFAMPRSSSRVQVWAMPAAVSPPARNEMLN